MNFNYFCKVKIITEMKKIIVFIISIIVFTALFSSCASYAKCPAYGHYSQVQPVAVDENSL
jgi:hypothetical protein